MAEPVFWCSAKHAAAQELGLAIKLAPADTAAAGRSHAAPFSRRRLALRTLSSLALAGELAGHCSCSGLSGAPRMLSSNKALHAGKLTAFNTDGKRA